MHLPHIVIIGGGAGGLVLATKLGNSLGKKSLAKITLVDNHLTHVWKPLLHKLAAGTLYPQDIEISFLAHAKQHYFNFQLGTFEKINRKLKKITFNEVRDGKGKMLLAEHTLSYDILVIAIGSVSNEFGVPGVKEHCYFLDNPEQAHSFHEIFLHRWLNLSAKTAAQKQMNLAIIGGGATGVELAAEVQGMSQDIAKYTNQSQLDSPKVNISLLEAAPRLLPVLPEKISKKVLNVLKKMQITVYTNEQVSRVDEKGVFTKSGLFLPADISVWAAGIKAPPFLANLDGLATNQRNQLLVKPTLQTTEDDNIFAFGDCSACPIDEKNLVPPRAQAAHQQAKLLAKSLTGYIKGKPLLSYQYRDYGSLVAMSNRAVGNLMQILARDWMLEGTLAKLVYLSLYQDHLIALHGIWRSSLQTISNFFTRKIKPKLKLH